MRAERASPQQAEAALLPPRLAMVVVAVVAVVGW